MFMYRGLLRLDSQRPFSSASPNTPVENPKPRKSFFRRHWGKLSIVLGLTGALITLSASALTIDRSSQKYGVLYHEPWQLKVLGRLPWRTLSHVWGYVHEIPLPVFLRVRMFQLWTDMYGCNLEEMSAPLESYKNLQEFFTRRLKPGVRPLDPSPIISPVDAAVFTFGELAYPNTHHTSFRIKGLDYPVSHFLGSVPTPKKGKSIFYSIFYLAPGDYHGIHSPADWNIQARTHFPGYLFPVAPVVLQIINTIFLQNERVVLEGTWNAGDYFSLTSVGATNVGSIAIKNEPGFQTNRRDQRALPLTSIPVNEVQLYEKEFETKKGEEVAFFRLGSCVVLVFEADQSFQFTLTEGAKIRIGQSLGDVVSNLP